MTSSFSLKNFINKYLFLNTKEIKEKDDTLEILICHKKEGEEVLPEEIESKIKETINRRGFNEAVEIHKAYYEEKNIKNDVVIIGKEAVKPDNEEKIENILNKNLDNILYNALKEAKKDYKSN